MRKATLILLALAGCGQKTPRSAEPTDPAGAADLNLAVAAAPADPAQLQALIERGMAGSLRDPKAAQYRNVRAGAGGAACGEVAVKAGAPFLPFVVTPDALAVLGTKPDIAWEDPDDFLADAWIR
jgi:Prokaryotic lipoprotein-attachment site